MYPPRQISELVERWQHPVYYNPRGRHRIGRPRGQQRPGWESHPAGPTPSMTPVLPSLSQPCKFAVGVGFDAADRVAEFLVGCFIERCVRPQGVQRAAGECMPRRPPRVARSPSRRTIGTSSSPASLSSSSDENSEMFPDAWANPPIMSPAPCNKTSWWLPRASVRGFQQLVEPQHQINRPPLKRMTRPTGRNPRPHPARRSASGRLSFHGSSSSASSNPNSSFIVLRQFRRRLLGQPGGRFLVHRRVERLVDLVAAGQMLFDRPLHMLLPPPVLLERGVPPRFAPLHVVETRFLVLPRDRRMFRRPGQRAAGRVGQSARSGR